MKSVVCFLLIAGTVVSAFPFSWMDSLTHQRSAGDVVYTPAKLPCSFGMVETMVSMDEKGEELLTTVGNYYVDNKMAVGMLKTTNTWLESDGVFVFRPDETYTDVGKVFGYYFEADLASCLSEPVDLESLESRRQDMFAAIYKKKYFDGVNQTTYKGKKCKMYYKYDEKEMQTDYCYVDFNDFLLGHYMKDKRGFQYTEDFSFSLGKVPIEAFALNKTQYPYCTDEAYKLPVEQC